jgi:BASS family bile acid:Na+ symporter
MLFLGWLSPESDLRIDAFGIVKILLVTQMLPLAVGLAIHERAPRLTAWIARPIALLANVLLLAVVALILGTQYQTLAALRVRGWVGMTLLLAASLGIGWLEGGLFSDAGEPA